MEKKSFGEFLAEKRKENKLTQKDLSGMLFVSESTVCKWEKNVAHPDLSMVQKLSEILGVTEHELISASVDETDRENRTFAKKWKRLSKFWELFFLISYGITVITCFIVNLAVERKLSWFFVVFFSLVLSASFTTFPKYIKKHKTVFIPLTELLALILLFAVINIYTGGSWFFLATLPTACGFVIVMFPIMIAKSGAFAKIKPYNAYVSTTIDFFFLFFMLLYINNYTHGKWFLSLALPLLSFAFVFALVHIVVLKTKRINGFTKTAVLTFLWDAVFILVGYGIYPFLKKAGVDTENSTPFAPFKVNLSVWTDEFINYNVCFILFLSLFVLSTVFGVFGVIKAKRKRKRISR